MKKCGGIKGLGAELCGRRKHIIVMGIKSIKLQGRSCNHKSTLVQDQGLLLFISYHRECLYENIYYCMLRAASSLNGNPSCKGLAALLVG